MLGQAKRGAVAVFRPLDLLLRLLHGSQQFHRHLALVDLLQILRLAILQIGQQLGVDAPAAFQFVGQPLQVAAAHHLVPAQVVERRG